MLTLAAVCEVPAWPEADTDNCSHPETKQDGNQLRVLVQ